MLGYSSSELGLGEAVNMGYLLCVIVISMATPPQVPENMLKLVR